MEPMIRVARSADWEVTRRCDSRCSHCISRLHHPRLSGELDGAGALQVVERLAEAGIHAVHLYGGEPLVRPDLLPLLRACDERGIHTSMTTNGRSLDAEVAAALGSLLHFQGMTVSFEDIREREQDAVRGPGAHCSALACLRAMTTHAPDVPLTVAWTLTRPALEALHPAEIASFFAAYGVRQVVIQDLAVPPGASGPLRALDYGGERWESFLRRLFHPAVALPIPVIYPLKPLVVDYLDRTYGYQLPLMRYGCKAMSSRIRVLPDGRVLPCSATIGWDSALRTYLEASPSLVDMPLDELLQLEPYQRFARIKRERTDPVMEPCGACKYAYFRCNPCVLGRLSGEAKVVRNCQWVMRAAARPARRRQVAASAQVSP